MHDRFGSARKGVRLLLLAVSLLLLCVQLHACADADCLLCAQTDGRQLLLCPCAAWVGLLCFALLPKAVSKNGFPFAQELSVATPVSEKSKLSF